MSQTFTFELQRTRFDEHYQPAQHTRLTTNFANLARGPARAQNLRNTLHMINSRFNALAHWDNPQADRYAVELDIICVHMQLAGQVRSEAFPLIEVLHTCIVDQHTGQRTAGIVGNSFSSYVRDYDFSVLLPQHNAGRAQFSTPEGFGQLHGQLFKHFVHSATYQAHFDKPPVICISVAASKTYHRTGNVHPVLGLEYAQNTPSATDHYFAHMGLQVRFFMPPNAVAPLAFYFQGDLLNDYSNLELIATISTMETFQKIYRPEIYNANGTAGYVYQPSLTYQNYSLTQVDYDRVERSQLAVQQGQYTQQHFIEPYQQVLQQWVAQSAL